MNNFSEKERFCEATFASGGPYWHAYTNGKDTPLIFARDEDFALAMNVIAQAAAAFPSVIIISFEVMGNHFHFVLSGVESDIYAFWRYIRKRLSRTFKQMSDMPLQLKPIEDLQSLRSHIVYVHRNGYVVNPDSTPFSYPWGTGRYYFLGPPEGTPLKEIFYDDRRKMFRARTPDVPLEWNAQNGYVLPSEYCVLKFGMAMFRDAHHYFNQLCKNVESYSGIAVELDDGEFLTDPELFAQISKILKPSYGIDKISALTRAQKLDLAKKLHYDYRSSNGQIRRLLGLSAYDVDSLFPLTKG